MGNEEGLKVIFGSGAEGKVGEPGDKKPEDKGSGGGRDMVPLAELIRMRQGKAQAKDISSQLGEQNKMLRALLSIKTVEEKSDPYGWDEKERDPSDSVIKTRPVIQIPPVTEPEVASQHTVADIQEMEREVSRLYPDYFEVTKDFDQLMQDEPSLRDAVMDSEHPPATAYKLALTMQDKSGVVKKVVTEAEVKKDVINESLENRLKEVKNLETPQEEKGRRIEFSEDLPKVPVETKNVAPMGNSITIDQLLSIPEEDFGKVWLKIPKGQRDELRKSMAEQANYVIGGEGVSG